MRSRPLAALAAFALILASSSAAAQSAPQAVPPASEEARAGADLNEASALDNKTWWIVGAIALALIIWGLIELIDDGDEDVPVSP